jgi:serine/threonine-protein kinase HipA
MSVREAHVFKGDRLAAVLRRLSDEPTFTPAGAVPPYFAGLLPEGRRLSNLRRAVKTSADDDLSLLLAVGADTVGDVTSLPVGQVPNEPQPLVVADRDFDQLSFGDLLDAAGVIDPVALAGVQDKMSTRVLSLPVQYAGRRYILKLDTPETPHIVANEDYFIRLAAAHFPVVSASVVRDSTDRPGLLVQRFDRKTSPAGGTVSLAVEDGAQVHGIYPAHKYAVSAETVVGRLSSLCASRAVALRDLYRQLVFAWLTGNGDVHAKNLSIF